MNRKLLILLGGVLFAVCLVIYADDGNEPDTAIKPEAAPAVEVPMAEEAKPEAAAPVAAEEIPAVAPVEEMKTEAVPEAAPEVAPAVEAPAPMAEEAKPEAAAPVAAEEKEAAPAVTAPEEVKKEEPAPATETGKKKKKAKAAPAAAPAPAEAPKAEAAPAEPAPAAVSAPAEAEAPKTAEVPKTEAKPAETKSSDIGYIILKTVIMYIPNRIVDALDIATFDIGVGPTFGAEARVTRWLQFGGMYGDRYFIGKDYARQIGGGYDGGWNYELFCLSSERRYIDDTFGTTKEYITKRKPMGLTTLKDPACTYENNIRDFWEVGARAGWLVSFGVAVHPVEIADLVAGFFLLDIMGDDYGKAVPAAKDEKK